jgi:peptidyl-prolyl cis-trans isomerase SurA
MFRSLTGTGLTSFISTALMLCLVAVQSIAATNANDETALDRIVATINDDVLTESELDELIVNAHNNMRGRKIKLPPAELLRQQVLKQAILENLQLQLAARIGIRISEADIDGAIDRVKKTNKLSQKSLLKKLKRDGLTLEKYREQLRKELTMQKLLDREVRRRVHISEAEITDFLAQRQQASNDAYHLSHILLPLPETATPEVINKLLQQAMSLVTQLRNGASFKTLAAAHSQGREALDGGVLGWRPSGQLPDLFVNALSKMKKGAVSEPLRSANGFHIIKLNDKRSSRKSKTVTQTRASHILVRTNAVMPEAEARNKIVMLRQRLEAGDDFAHVAQTHSDDPGSAAKGGELGWVNPGQTVPGFEKAMNSLKPGQLSQPVKSAFGFHLIKVLERRQQDIGDQLDRSKAGEQLRMRKSEERYQQWLRQLQDEAYIQILIDGE